MMVLGPRYRELLKEIFVKKTLSADFSLYLHRPTATDTSLAPAGCDSFYVVSPVHISMRASTGQRGRALPQDG